MKRIVVTMLALLIVLSDAEAETDMKKYLDVSPELYILENDYVEEIYEICFSIHGICTDGINLFADYRCTVKDADDAEVIFWDGLTLHNIDTLHTDPSEKDIYYVCAWPVIDNYLAVDTFDYEVVGNTVHCLTRGEISPIRDYESLINQIKGNIHSEEYVTVHFRISVIKVDCGFTAFNQYDVFYDCPVTIPDYCRTFSETIEIDSKPIDFSFSYIETPFDIYLFTEDNDPSCEYFICNAAGNILSTRIVKITRDTLQTIRKSSQLYIAKSSSDFYSRKRVKIICKDTQSNYAEFELP